MIFILILTIITTILTAFSVIFAGIQLLKLNKSKKNVNKNAKKLYIQKTRDNKDYIKSNLSSLKKSLEMQGYTKEELYNIWILPYYIITLNNSTFEKVIKNLITDTEEIIKTNIDNDQQEIENLTNLHKVLEETSKIMENGNYLINLFFHDFDIKLQEDLKYISSSDEFQNKVPNNTLYTPGGDPNTLIYATPIMYYNNQIANIKNHLKNNQDNDIQYISINDFDTRTQSGSLIKSLQINTIFKNLQEIIDTIENLKEN
ncbi:hypothetical protein [Staphylococcus saprophyticus]|uniref:hypothetical protein n=1 Tax=Staphylococcus TaxID=1279 RepID=UPI000E682E63|nr:hypothetical protein [Staphylococcus saprophyticus]RIO26753.1 hypothetical protein BUZ81_06105 [Staphylococcus saprophyticus]